MNKPRRAHLLFQAFFALMLLFGFKSNAQLFSKPDTVEAYAKKITDPHKAIKYLMREAEKNQLTDASKCLKYAAAAKSIAEKNNLKRELAYTTFYYGVSQCYNRQFEEGKATMNESLTEWQKYRLTNDTGYINNLLMLSYFDRDSLRSFNRASTAYNTAVDINSKKWIAKSLKQLGLCYYIFNEDKAKAMSYYKRALDVAMESGDKQTIGEAHESIGWILGLDNQYPKAIEQMQLAVNNYKEVGASAKCVGALNVLSSFYSAINNNEMALNKIIESVRMLEEKNDKAPLILAYNNLAAFFVDAGDYKSAIEYLQKSESLSVQIKNDKFLYDIYRTYSKAYELMGNYDKAIEFSLKEVKESERLEGPGITAKAYITLAEIYFQKKDYQKALSTIDKSVSFAKEYRELTKDVSTDLIWEINLNKSRYLFASGDTAGALQFGESAWQQVMNSQNAVQKYRVASHLANVYDALNMLKKSIDFKNLTLQLNDSINNMERTKLTLELLSKFEIEKRDKEIALLNREYEVKTLNLKQRESELKLEKITTEKQQNELLLANRDKSLKESELRKTNLQLEREKAEKELLNQQKKLKDAESKRQSQFLRFMLAGMVLLAISLISILIALQQKQRHNKMIANEKRRSDELLLNILPEETAEELKNHGKAEAKYYEAVSVLFTDFVNFTSISEKLGAQDLVAEIDYCFKAFDEIIYHNGLEKIKTIGDAYMAVCGLPNPDKDHGYKCTKAALDILEFMNKYKAERISQNKMYFDLRLGINSGPVVAGIVGIKKFAYDIWGDTVNTASRMEQNSIPGKINISESTYELIKDKFDCSHRGKLEAKHKGLIDMYFVQAPIQFNDSLSGNNFVKANSN